MSKKEYEYYPSALAHYSIGAIVGYQYINLISIYELQKVIFLINIRLE